VVEVLGVVRSRGKAEPIRRRATLDGTEVAKIETIRQKGREIVLPAFPALTASESEGAGASCSCWVSRERQGQSPYE
jgi:hypothetical protein